MAKKQVKDLKEGDKIISFNQKFIIKKIEFSEKGVKQGRAKSRIEVENEQTGEQKVIIKLAEESVDTA